MNPAGRAITLSSVMRPGSTPTSHPSWIMCSGRLLPLESEAVIPGFCWRNAATIRDTMNCPRSIVAKSREMSFQGCVIFPQPADPPPPHGR